MYKILVVDDEKKYRDLISMFLQMEKMDVMCAADGQEALAFFDQGGIDLIVLDVMLPDMSGFDVCRRIRQTSEVPILFLTALDDEDYHIIGYRSGADDYIEKPFKSSVLALKIQRILSRAADREDRRLVYLAGIELDPDGFTVTADGHALELTQKEFEVLHELMRHRSRVLTRDYLIHNVWGFDYDGETRVVDVLITKLRKKLGPRAGLIKTVINVGYRMEES